MRKAASTNSKDITAERLAELKENARGILADVRRNMIYRFPFIGSIAMTLDLVPTRDRRNPTAATDGSAIYFDIDFLSTLTNDERMFVFAHEVWHNVLLHLVRRENRDHQMFNIATDLEVNQLLVKDGLSLPKNVLTPQNQRVPVDLSAEEYYEILAKRNQQQQNQKSKSGQSGQSSGAGQDDDGDGSEQNESDENKSGNSEGKMENQFDKHVYEGEDSSEDKSGKDVADKYGKVGEDPDYRPKATKSSVEHVREAAVSAAQTIMRQRGELPAHIAGIVNKLVEPEISWKDVLNQFVTRNCGGDLRTWNPPSRRYIWTGSYLQGSRSEKIKIAVGIDTSGSTGRDMGKFLGELNGLVKSFGNYELHVIQCDAAVGKYEMFDEDNPLDLEHTNFEVTGGGGTVLHPIFDYVKDNNLDVDAIVVFTDGYVEEFPAKDAPDAPVLWVLTKDGQEGNFGFGEVTKFKQ